MNCWLGLGVGAVAGFLSLVTTGSEATAQLANPKPSEIRTKGSAIPRESVLLGEGRCQRKSICWAWTGFVVSGPGKSEVDRHRGPRVLDHGPEA